MKRWTEDEISYLNLHYLDQSHREMAGVLGRTEQAVRNKCWRMGFVQDRLWSDAEIQRLREVYDAAGRTGPVNLRWLELAFGRKKSNICHKARQLGLVTTSGRMAGDWNRAEASNRLVTRRKNSGLPRGGWVNMRAGKRSDLGDQFFRSSWEANYGRYLNFLLRHDAIAGWKYECVTFEFEKIRRGTRSYTPDFEVQNTDGSVEYHEVKGWMDPKSKTKLKRMAKYYPGVKIVLIGKEEYSAIARECKRLVPNWE